MSNKDIPFWIGISGVIVNKPCIFKGMTVKAGGVAEVGAVLYDNALAASGIKVADIGIAAAGDTTATPPVNVRCDNGLYIDTINTQCTVYYELED